MSVEHSGSLNNYDIVRQAEEIAGNAWERWYVGGEGGPGLW